MLSLEHFPLSQPWTVMQPQSNLKTTVSAVGRLGKLDDSGSMYLSREDGRMVAGVWHKESPSPFPNMAQSVLARSQPRRTWPAATVVTGSNQRLLT